MHNKSYPLTREQQGLWIEWKISPEGLSYNTCVQLKLQGDLDVVRFCRTASDVVDYFELLRSYCVPLNDQVYLAFSQQPYQLETIDLWAEYRPGSSAEEGESSDLEPEELKQRALKILDEKRQVSLNLTRFPLISAALIKTAPRTYYFTGVVPHLISDGASAIYFLMAFSTAYNRGRQALIDEFSEKNHSWGDYLQRRSELDSERDEMAARQYWAQYLSGAVHRIELSHSTESPEDSVGKREHLQLSQDVSTKLKALARKNRTSLFSVMAALFATLLYRYSTQQDFLVGYPVDLRPRGFRNAFGLFVNIIPLRIRLEADFSFNQLIATIHQQRKADKAYQYLPSLEIVKAHRIDTPEFDGRMFNVSMAETVSRLQNLFLDNIASEPLDTERVDIRDDLVWMYENNEEGIGIWLEFREILFDAAARARIMAQVNRLIASVVQAPEQVITGIELSSPLERTVLLKSWNQTQEPCRKLKLHQFFEHQAEIHPDAIALQMNSDTISYAALNAQADRMAAWLLQWHAVKNGIVALALKRSPDQIAIMLAVLKAGAAYLPLDPEWPDARLDHILRNASPCLLIREEAGQDFEHTPACSRHDIVQSNLPAYAKTVLPGHTEQIQNLADSRLAYVIYTSGSTGKPKGVLVSHAAVALRIDGLCQQLPLTQEDKVLHNTNSAFDVSVAEIFWPLASGARLILVEPDQHRNPRVLLDLIASNSISTACFVPSALGVLLSQVGKSSQLSSLKQVICAGEVLSLNTARQFFSRSSGRLFNFYGPTEATIYTTWHECLKTDDFLPIGRPLANTSCYVLDHNLQPVPLGAQGELFIGGPGLADGYVENSEINRNRFIDNPFDEGMLYRTGDMVRSLDNGELDFLRRNDEQIKLRGYRIELGEISNRLLDMPEIEDAVVVLRRINNSREAQLCAYYSTNRGKSGATEAGGNSNKLTLSLSPQDLRRHLAGELPEYMIPSHFIAMNALPRRSSGKIDTELLPAVKAELVAHKNRPPESEREKILAQIFSDVLRIPLTAIGLDSNFFELGGDSMMIIEVACAAEEQQIFIEVHELFIHRTIADILQHARNTPAYQFDQAEVDGEFPALPRHIKLFRDGFVNPSHWNRHILLQFDTPVPIDVLQAALNAVVEHHDGLRIGFESEVLAFNSPNPLSTQIQSSDICHMNGREQKRAIRDAMNAAHASLDLGRPPLFRVLYFKTGEHRFQLALVLHHLLIDMRSSRLLLEDLLLGCQQLLAGRGVQLPPKTSSLKVWAERINFYANHHDLEQETAYWCRQLQPSARLLLNDKNATIPSLESHQTKQRVFLSREATQSLTTEVKNRFEVEIHQLVVWCLADAYYEWSGLDSLTFNTCGHGREKVFDDISLARTVGELNTVFPLRLELPLADGLASVTTAYRNLPNRGWHYGMLRYLLESPQITRLPEPEIFFNYVSRIDTQLPESLAQALPVTLIEPPPGVNTAAPENKVCYTLYLEAGIIDQQFFVSVNYDVRWFSEARVRELLTGMTERLSRISECSIETTQAVNGSA